MGDGASSGLQIIWYVVGMILFISSIYLAARCKASIGGWIVAVLLPPIYVPYKLATRDGCPKKLF